MTRAGFIASAGSRQTPFLPHLPTSIRSPPFSRSWAPVHSRWGKQAAGSFVLYDPFRSGKFKNDLFSADVCGAAYNWVQPTGVDRDESNVEFFYRFPLFPEADATVSYQAVINPALDPDNDFGSAFSFRLRSTF